MQTFLPYPDFAASAAVLDNKRLGKQRVENLQIFQAVLGARIKIDEATNEWSLTFGRIGWSNHPATKMWERDLLSLIHYQDAICSEWLGRGYRDTCMNKTQFLFEHAARTDALKDRLGSNPAWLGREDLHASHRANLLRKDPEWYGQYGWTEEPADGYIWPV